MLRVCHDSASVVQAMGRSGIMTSNVLCGRYRPFYEIRKKRLRSAAHRHVTVLRVWHDSVSVVLLQSVCLGILDQRSYMGHFIKSIKMLLFL